MQDLINDLRTQIIDTLQLRDVTPDQITEHGQLVGEVLDIDSIDILELVMMIEERYGIRIDSKELGAKVFSTLHTLAEFIHTHRQDPSGSGN